MLVNENEPFLPPTENIFLSNPSLSSEHLPPFCFAFKNTEQNASNATLVILWLTYRIPIINNQLGMQQNFKINYS